MQEGKVSAGKAVQEPESLPAADLPELLMKIIIFRRFLSSLIQVITGCGSRKVRARLRDGHIWLLYRTKGMRPQGRLAPAQTDLCQVNKEVTLW